MLPASQTKDQRIPTILAFALLPLSGFATDIYIPSLPSMGSGLHASSLQVQLTLTLFLVSYGVSQLFLGSVLDAYGRYKLQEQRLKETYYLLKEQGRKVSDVYLDAGFKDLSQFSFAFKKTYGVAPSQIE